MKLTVEEEPKWKGFGNEWLATTIIDSIREHCLQHDTLIKNAILKLTIHRAESNDHVSALRLSLSGTVNGRAISKSCSAIRSNVYGSAGGLMGHIVSELVNRAVTTALDYTVAQDPKFIQCLAEILATLQAAIDQAAGVGPCELTKKWNRLQFAGKLLFAGSFVVAIPAAAFGIHRKLDLASLPIFALFVLLFGVVLGGGLNFLIWSTGLLLFPDRFYFDEPIGRRVLARTGLQTPLQVRVLVLLIFTGIVAIGLFTSMYSLAE